jgi:uncharacterized damage-inducible protein DinB
MQRLDYLEHLERESGLFAAAVLAAAPDAPVPTCPGWTAADLLWHLAEVQWFWGEIVRSGAQSPDDYVEPVRPGDQAALEAFYQVASGGLLAALAAADQGRPRGRGRRTRPSGSSAGGRPTRRSSTGWTPS